VLIRTLKPLVEAMPTAKVHMNHRFTALRDCGDYIEADFETPDGVRTVQGAYLCGADGSNSTVRKQLGLDFSGLTYEDRFLLVAGDLDLKPHFPQIGPVNYIYDPKEWVIILHLPDIVRIVFRLRPEEDEAEAQAEQAVRQRVAGFVGQDVPFNIKNVSIYRVHQRVANTFRVGRTLLLGDAAHINNPAGGMGMNSGIHDAHYLAQVLAEIVLNGVADGLLDQYDAVRRQEAVDNIRSYSDKNYADLSASDEAYRRQRNETLRKTAVDPALSREYLLKASMLADRI
jgi:3-(3-hydroxy-phenyl)propionate hydroxylase